MYNVVLFIRGDGQTLGCYWPLLARGGLTEPVRLDRTATVARSRDRSWHPLWILPRTVYRPCSCPFDGISYRFAFRASTRPLASSLQCPPFCKLPATKNSYFNSFDNCSNVQKQKFSVHYRWSESKSPSDKLYTKLKMFLTMFVKQRKKRCPVLKNFFSNKLIFVWDWLLLLNINRNL